MCRCMCSGTGICAGEVQCVYVCVRVRCTIAALCLFRLDGIGIFGLLQSRCLAGRKRRLLGLSALLADVFLGRLRLVRGLALGGGVSQDG